MANCRQCNYNVADYGDYYFCQAKGKLVQYIETCEYEDIGEIEHD